MELANDQNNNLGIDELFKEYFKPLCAYCQYNFGFPIDAAKDIVHSVFIKLLECGLSFSSEFTAKSYLYKSTRNSCIDRIRHEKIKQQHELFVQKNAEADVENYNLTELKELQNDIDKAITELPDQMRAIFYLSRNEGLKYAEIALKLDISVKTVETQMSRAFGKLRQKLATYLSLLVIAVDLSQL